MNNKKTNKEHKFGSVCLIGRPNAGKSTLLNYIIGEKISIVTDKPQTTRTRIEGIITDKDYQMVIMDTPGIHKPKDKLGSQMVAAAMTSIEAADVVFYIVDATGDFGVGEQYIIDNLKKVKQPVFLLLNKVDLLEKEKLFSIIMEYNQKMHFAEVFPISALKGDNISDLLKTTAEYLPEGPKAYDDDEMTDQPERVIVAEMIREKAINATSKEVPYAIACIVESLKDRREDLVDIMATIIVERDGQKAILIGKGGETLKRIGIEARKDIENLMGVQVNLKLWVKVKEDWRNRPQDLKELGLN